ncbi:MAG: peptidase domain-containing ABC transporter [Marinifilum sp.]|jgi:ATP-binding cassette subfamily B protein|nr:peptidase domain-containing ABC transporter [Marinifilum sp.]
MKYTFFKQLDAMDCGPTCVQMVAKYYGRYYSLEQLREKSYVTREGVSMLGISDCAESIGFRTLAGRFTFDKLIEQAPLPCIVHWRQEHFVVVYAIKKKSFLKRTDIQIIVADPGKGIIKYDKDEFVENWISTKTRGEDKGVALLLEPTSKFYKQESEKKDTKSFSLLFSYFGRYKKYFTQLLLGLLLGSILQLIFPFLTQAIVDVGISDQNLGFIYLILIAQLVLFISRMSVDFIRKWILLHISTRINVSLISDFLIKLMKLPMSFFDTKLVGDLLQRIEDHRRIERFLTAQSLGVVFSLFNFIVFGIVLLTYSFKIFAIFLVGSVLYALWIFIFLKKRRILDYQFFEQQALNQSKTYQLINGMQEIKLQNCEKRKRWEWEDVQADLFHVNVASLSLQQSQEGGTVFINELKNILITVVAATAVINGSLTLGMMLAIQYIIGQLNSPLEQMVGFIHNMQDVKISLDRLSEIHRKENEGEQNKTKSWKFSSGNLSIDIENVSFRYEGPHSPKVLNNIDLFIPEGKVTAIVGASGSGKTTLIKLLMGYYSPSHGTIKVDQQQLSQYDLRWWRNQCGAVMQDGFIFSESIAKNIAVSDEEIDKDKLLHAAKVTNCHDFVKELPLAYNTIIGQEGQGISQGQRQRILIARAVYKNPDFLFLDEATNALDANNEKAILESLEEFYRGKTVVVVAHRLSTVKNADQIIVLDKGTIAEQGTHKELTALKGKYYNLVKNQLELGN